MKKGTLTVSITIPLALIALAAAALILINQAHASGYDTQSISRRGCFLTL